MKESTFSGTEVKMRAVAGLLVSVSVRVTLRLVNDGFEQTELFSLPSKSSEVTR